MEESQIRNLRVLTGDSHAKRKRSPRELEREVGLRFVMRVRGEKTSASDVKEAILRTHDLTVEVRAFPRSHAPASVDERRFVLVIPGISRVDIPENPFDLASRLQETHGLDIVLVEPDQPSLTYVGNFASPNAAMFGILSCQVDDQPSLPADWHVHAINAPAAWALTPSATGRQFGEGIVIGHPDTGWVEHVELDSAALDLEKSYDFVDDDKNARDPLTREWFEFGPLAQPGHGLGTGSVIISRHESGVLQGIAPKARLVPIRTTKRVWQILSGNIAEAIDHAILQGCHVVSISLGGFALFHLEEAVNDAVEHNIILCAAAGNCIHVVPFPAAYPGCVAVAPTDNNDQPWEGSSQGSAVDIAAPGVNIWVARRDRDEPGKTRIGQSQGASPATAATAGLAALWLGFHGRDALIARYANSPVRLHHVFVFLLQKTARRPAGWNGAEFGAGIIDAHAMLVTPLPTAEEVVAEGTMREPYTPASSTELIARFTGLSQDAVRIRLGMIFGEGQVGALASPQIDDRIDRNAQELMVLLAENRAAFLEFVTLPSGPREGAAGALRAPDGTVAPMSEFVRGASSRFREDMAIATDSLR